MTLVRPSPSEARKSWLEAQPYLLLFQTVKTLGYGASVGYYTGFGGQRETTVRRNLRRLVDKRYLRRKPARWDRGFDYFLTAKGFRAVWAGGNPAL